MGSDLSKARELLEKMKKDRADRENGDIKYYNIKEGENMFRILPAWRPEVALPFKEVWYHYLKLPTGKDTSLVCPKLNTPSSACPICELCEVLLSSDKPEEKELYYSMKSKPRWFFNIIDRNDPANNPKVFGFSAKTILEGILALFVNTDYGDIADTVTGTDVIITRTGKTKNDTKYSVTGRRKESALTPEELVMLKTLRNLDEMVRVESYENITKILEGEEVTTSETASPASAPAPISPQLVVEPTPAPVVHQNPPVTVDVQPTTTTPTPQKNQVVLDKVKQKLAELNAKNKAK